MIVNPQVTGDLGRGREEVERDWPAVWDRGRGRYALSAKSQAGFSESIVAKELTRKPATAEM
jgi:hypothetical protein